MLAVLPQGAGVRMVDAESTDGRVAEALAHGSGGVALGLGCKQIAWLPISL